MTSPYELFGTNTDHETKGVEIDYGSFSITVARAGGSNRKYAKILEQKTKPIRRALATGQVDPKRVVAIMREVFAEAVVLDWQGVTDKEGKKLAFNTKNCIKLFEDLPDLFADIQNQASSLQLFQDVDTEADQGNS